MLFGVEGRLGKSKANHLEVYFCTAIKGSGLARASKDPFRNISSHCASKSIREKSSTPRVSVFDLV